MHHRLRFRTFEVVRSPSLLRQSIVALEGYHSFSSHLSSTSKRIGSECDTLCFATISPVLTCFRLLEVLLPSSVVSC